MLDTTIYIDIWPLEPLADTLPPFVLAAAHMHVANPRRLAPRPSSSKRCFTEDKGSSSRVSACLCHDAAAAPLDVTSARARGECRRADNNILSFDGSVHVQPQRPGKRVELQRPQAYHNEFRPSIAHTVDIGRNTAGNLLAHDPQQVTHFSGPSMMFSPMKTPGRPRTAPPPPSSDFIKHPPPSPEIKRTRALVVPAHLQRKETGSSLSDFPKPGVKPNPSKNESKTELLHWSSRPAANTWRDEYTLKQRSHGDRDKRQLFGSDVPFGTSPAPSAAASAPARADVRALAAATAALLLSDRHYGRSHVMSRHMDV